VPQLSVKSATSSPDPTVVLEWVVFAILWLATAAIGLYVASAGPDDRRSGTPPVALRPLREPIGN
jgi:hypothetical protein